MSKKLLPCIALLIFLVAFSPAVLAQRVINDFETDIGNWKDPNTSGSTNVDAASTFEVSADFAYEGTQSGKLTLINDDTPADGWFVRLVTG